MRLEMSILAGDESKKFLADLSQAVERLEKAAGKITAGKTSSNDDADEEVATAAPQPKRGRPAKSKAFPASFVEESEEAEESDEEEVAPPKKKGKVAAASFDDEEDAEEESDEEEVAPKKKARGKLVEGGLSLDNINDACMERAKRTSRDEVQALLKKHFNVKSITALDPEDYLECMKLMRRK